MSWKEKTLGYNKHIDKDLELYIKEISEFPFLSCEEERDLVIKFKEGDLFAKERLICSQLAWVVHVAKEYSFDGVSLSDLIQEGNLGLIKAIDHYDLSYGCRLYTYTDYYIRKSIFNFVQEKFGLVRIPARASYSLYRLRKIQEMLTVSFGREPTVSELADNLNLKEEKVREIKTWERFWNFVSLSSDEKDDAMEWLPEFLGNPLYEEEDVIDHLHGGIDNFSDLDHLFQVVDSSSKLLHLMEILFCCLNAKELAIIMTRYGLCDGVCYDDYRIAESLGYKSGGSVSATVSAAFSKVRKYKDFRKYVKGEYVFQDIFGQKEYVIKVQDVEENVSNIVGKSMRFGIDGVHKEWNASVKANERKLVRGKLYSGGNYGAN